MVHKRCDFKNLLIQHHGSLCTAFNNSARRRNIGLAIHGLTENAKVDDSLANDFATDYRLEEIAVLQRRHLIRLVQFFSPFEGHDHIHFAGGDGAGKSKTALAFQFLGPIYYSFASQKVIPIFLVETNAEAENLKQRLALFHRFYDMLWSCSGPGPNEAGNITSFGRYYTSARSCGFPEILVLGKDWKSGDVLMSALNETYQELAKLADLYTREKSFPMLIFDDAGHEPGKLHALVKKAFANLKGSQLITFSKSPAKPSNLIRRHNLFIRPHISKRLLINAGKNMENGLITISLQKFGKYYGDLFWGSASIRALFTSSQFRAHPLQLKFDNWSNYRSVFSMKLIALLTQYFSEISGEQSVGVLLRFPIKSQVFDHVVSCFMNNASDFNPIANYSAEDSNFTDKVKSAILTSRMHYVILASNEEEWKYPFPRLGLCIDFSAAINERGNSNLLSHFSKKGMARRPLIVLPNQE